jgi:hypothetical protein
MGGFESSNLDVAGFVPVTGLLQTFMVKNPQLPIKY